METYLHWLRNREMSDELERSRVRIILIFQLLCISVSLFYWLIAPFVVLNIPRVIFIALPSLLLIPFTLLFTGRIGSGVAGTVFIAVCWTMFGAGTYFSGGIHSVVLPWFALMPVMANLTLGYRNSVLWFVISMVTLAVFILIQSGIPEVRFTGGPWRVVMSVGGLCLILFFFTSLFDRARYKLLQVLREQNEEIKSQMQVIKDINLQLTDKVDEINTSHVTLEAHWNTLLDLSKNKTINLGHLDKALPHVLKVAAKSLGVNRVGVWAYHQEPERIECLLAYDVTGDSFSNGMVLSREANTSYFDAIRRQKIMAVTDVREHEDTRDFAASYLDPLRIQSMMDAPFFIDGELKGVLCCENTNERRRWSCEDIIFATALADIITIAYRCSMRNDYEKRIKEMNKRISTANEQLVLKTGEVERANQQLEERVAARTKELTLQNRHLAEYAFINSHLLRGPVARVMGLVEVLEMETSDESKKEIMSRLRETSRELDDVVMKINNAIEKGSHFGRENFS